MDKNNNNKKVVDPSESCADCKYHHCKRSCQYNSETCLNDGECLFTGEVNRRCWERRCEHFKSWRTIKK